MKTDITTDSNSDHRVLRTKKYPLWPHISMALYGAGWAIAADVGGRIYGAELVAILALVILKWSKIFSRYPILKKILFAYGLLIFGILISDFINATDPFDTLRNLFTPMLGALGLVFVVSCVARAPRSLLTYLITIGVAKAFLGDPAYGDAFENLSVSWATVQEQSNFFKVRFEPALTPLAVAVAFLLGRRNKKFSGLWFIAVSVVYFFLDARSAGLALFFAGMAVLHNHQNRRLKRSRAFITTIVALLLGYGSYIAYINYSLNSEMPGQTAFQLQYVENPYNPIALLLIGRSEWLIMPLAISERPIFGWGSWAQDDNGRFANLRLSEMGSTSVYSSEQTSKQYIPAHSIVASAWLWSGILGFFSMVWLARLIWPMVITLRYLRSPLLPVACYLAFGLIWHFFFSPPQLLRIYFPIALGALVVASASFIRQHR